MDGIQEITVLYEGESVLQENEDVLMSECWDPFNNTVVTVLHIMIS